MSPTAGGWVTGSHPMSTSVLCSTWNPNKLWRSNSMLILKGANQIHYSRHLKECALKSRHFGPKWHSLRSLPFQGPKILNFQGPPLPMNLEMDLAPSKSLRPAPHKGILIVILFLNEHHGYKIHNFDWKNLAQGLAIIDLSFSRFASSPR
jgi:hypothetical protein